jgi:hypothetical protein
MAMESPSRRRIIASSGRRAEAEKQRAKSGNHHVRYRAPSNLLMQKPPDPAPSLSPPPSPERYSGASHTRRIGEEQVPYTNKSDPFHRIERSRNANGELVRPKSPSFETADAPPAESSGTSDQAVAPQRLFDSEASSETSPEGAVLEAGTGA